MTLKQRTAFAWLLLAGVLLVSGYLMLRACGLSIGPWTVSWCVVSSSSSPQEPIVALLAQVEALELQLRQPPPCPVAAPQPEPIAPSPPRVEAPAPPLEPVPPLIPQPTPERPTLPQPGEGLRLPPDRQDLSFLEGCWESASAIVELTTGKPVEIRYCFQNDGRGVVEISKSDGAHCTAPIRAQRIGPNLKMQHGAVPCNQGGGFSEAIITCRPRNVEASCDVINYKNGKISEGRVVDGRFRRTQ